MPPWCRTFPQGFSHCSRVSLRLPDSALLPGNTSVTAACHQDPWGGLELQARATEPGAFGESGNKTSGHSRSRHGRPVLCSGCSRGTGPAVTPTSQTGDQGACSRTAEAAPDTGGLGSRAPRAEAELLGAVTGGGCSHLRSRPPPCTHGTERGPTWKAPRGSWARPAQPSGASQSAAPGQGPARVTLGS